MTSDPLGNEPSISGERSIALQSLAKRTKVDFIVAETVRVPISFIIGISFISGSLLGTFINVNKKK